MDHALGYKTDPRIVQLTAVLEVPTLLFLRADFFRLGRLHSDHRGVWIYIPTQLLFGDKSPPVTYFGARKLKLIDPRVVENYQQHLEKSCHTGDLFTKISKNCISLSHIHGRII